MKLKHISAKKTAEEVKKLAEYFVISSCSSSRDELLMD